MGRAKELQALHEAFEQGRGLVTISGMGGTGKTRLALEFARTRDHPTWFVDLGGVQRPEGVVAALADALRGAHRVTDAEDLLRAMSELGPAMVVLDAFEHLVDHSPATVAAWRRAAPDVQLLVTSRVPLGLTSEQVIVLAPMTPDDALALLATRAKLADYAFDADANHETLVDVTSRLEGIPLAIELAAARLQTLSAEQLLQRLEDRLAVLRTGKRNVAPRHAAMEATLDWSWALLTEAEQSALAQCTVFRSDFPVEAAEAVIQRPDATVDVLDLVQSLHGQGWLRTVGRGPTRQLALLDVVREYASQHLTSADEQEAQARHTAFYLQRTAHLVSSSALAEILLDGIDDTGLADVDHVEAIVRRPEVSARERTDAALAGFVLLLRQGPAPRVHQLLAEAQGALPDDAELSAARLALAAHHAKRFFGTPLKSFLTLADALKA
ncbi:MAG: hypothetical protein KTR31_30685, partial [Myxococcales bacterium]|nr:hypothetical protein [Myxococcales bacterium]